MPIPVQPKLYMWFFYRANKFHVRIKQKKLTQQIDFVVVLDFLCRNSIVYNWTEEMKLKFISPSVLCHQVRRVLNGDLHIFIVMRIVFGANVSTKITNRETVRLRWNGSPRVVRRWWLWWEQNKYGMYFMTFQVDAAICDDHLLHALILTAQVYHEAGNTTGKHRYGCLLT